jgi:hypothetical protein
VRRDARTPEELMNPSNIRRMARTVAALAACVPMMGAVAAAQTNYTYTVIADLYNCYNTGTPVINNQGMVAFGARCGAPLASVESILVMRGAGQEVTTVYEWPVNSTTSAAPATDVLSMNDDGVVAFAVGGNCPNLGATAIWKTAGGPPVVVHDICTQPGFTSVIRPSISNTGAVAFMAASANSYDNVVRVKDGALVTIAGPGTATESDVGTLTGALEPAINNNDVVTFLGQGVSNYGLFTGTGGSPTLISLGSSSIFNGISDSGRVAFISGDGAVKTSDGLTEMTIATPGPYQALDASTAASSASGRVAFRAQLSTGETGVFTGPDPNTDVVLKTGQEINGFGVVTSMFIAREAINDSGQVAMIVHFLDAGVPKVAIVRADPPNTAPIATDGSLTVDAGSSASGTLDASDPDGESFTFALVDNGAKGTAVLDDASTGAFTYTANAGSSGDDTFTFEVTDIRGLTSNVATMTVDIRPATTCAADVTSSIGVTRPKGKKSSGATQTVLLTNVSATPIAGPASLVLDALVPEGTTLTNAAGTTACTTPAGSPYVNVDVGSDGIWSPGERVEVVLEFALPPAGRGKKPALSYTHRVLEGPGER